MSEEAKTPDGDYVMMDSKGAVPGRGTVSMGFDDPNLTQEEKDHRMAIALQQQENAAAYDAHKKKHDAAVKANTNRTARSGVHSRLAAVRDHDHGMLSVPKEYTSDNAYHKNDTEYVAPADGFVPPKGASPQEIADAKLANELQKFEQVDAGTTRTMEQIVKEEHEDDEAQAHRTGRSNYQKKH